MVDPVTPNIGLAQPTRGSDVGVWDTPVNNNTAVLDLSIGGTATIPLNNSNVVLSAAQFQSGFIVFNSTLTGSVSITFPTSFTQAYDILHACTGSSAFTITLNTTTATGQDICCPPGEIFQIRNDGSNIKFRNFGRVGQYWDYCGSSVPNWVSGCTVPPYLNCDGTQFSSVTYPILATIFNSTVLPDSKGRVRYALNQGTTRNPLFGANVSSGGGSQTISQGNIPNYTINIPAGQGSHNHTTNAPLLVGGGAQVAFGSGFSLGTATVNANTLPGMTAPSGGSGVSYSVPGYTGGLTLVRAG
jgi:hypothetical protein